MKLKPVIISAFLGITAFSIALTASAAGTLTGQVGIEVVICEGCSVGNGDSSGSNNQWGSISFGTYADLPNIIDGAAVGSDGSSAMTVTCTSDLSHCNSARWPGSSRSIAINMPIRMRWWPAHPLPPFRRDSAS